MLIYMFDRRKTMRLNKYIAQSGLTSRRKADELIFNGNVKVNNITVKEPGLQVGEDDKVYVNGRLIKTEDKKIYIALNKPAGFVTTLKDEFERPTVVELLTDVSQRVFPVGRLDYNTTGLLLLTNDGDLAYKLTHPKHEITKVYRAKIAGNISDAKLRKLRTGIDIGGYVTRRARVDVVRQHSKYTVVEIEIHEGKNRQIRKMFKAVGHPVQELERIAIGEIRLGRLLQGHYRKLTEKEIEYLREATGALKI